MNTSIIGYSSSAAKKAILLLVSAGNIGQVSEFLHHRAGGVQHRAALILTAYGASREVKGIDPSDGIEICAAGRGGTDCNCDKIQRVDLHATTFCQKDSPAETVPNFAALATEFGEKAAKKLASCPSS